MKKRNVRSIIGHIDRIDDKGITGWAIGQDKIPNVTLRVGGQPHDVPILRRKRPDVEAIYGAFASHAGFFIPLEDLAPEEEVEQAKFLASLEVLADGERIGLSSASEAPSRLSARFTAFKTFVQGIFVPKQRISTSEADLPANHGATNSAPKIACITMVCNEEFYLPIWFRYYANLFGAENLYIIDNDSTHPPLACIDHPNAARANVIRLPKQRKAWGPKRSSSFEFDRARFEFISHLINGLLNYYDVVIHNDVDEVYIVDPEIAPDLRTFILKNKNFNVMAGLGLEIMHDYKREPAYNPSKHLFSQRHWGVFRIHHSKPHIVSRPVRIGGHGCNKSFRLFEGLYLLHLKYLDQKSLMARQQKLNALYKGGIGGPGSRWRLSPKDTRIALDKMLRSPERPWDIDLSICYEREAVMKPRHWMYEFIHALSVTERQAIQTDKFQIPERFRSIDFL